LNDQLGSSVGISADGSTIGGDTFQGAAYVFAKPGGGWVDENEVAKLTASDGASGDELGLSIAISADGSTLAAGAPIADVGGNSGQGAAYAYTRPQSGWTTATETAKLTASDGQPGDALGWSVAISLVGSTVVTGMPLAGSDAGQADVFGPSNAPPHNTVLPSIRGTPQSWLKLAALNGSWTSPDPLTYSYQWQRCDSDGTNCTDVSGMPGRPYYYKNTAADIGHLIQLIVTATDQENQTGQATSNPAGPVTASGV
jgi:hypothetical protein